ncbi:unnamed protein product [Closterium sp. NIES-65]|nr:unnamed protein product [Closterium sp. NIES-65]
MPPVCVICCYVLFFLPLSGWLTTKRRKSCKEELMELELAMERESWLTTKRRKTLKEELIEVELAMEREGERGELRQSGGDTVGDMEREMERERERERRERERERETEREREQEREWAREVERERQREWQTQWRQQQEQEEQEEQQRRQRRRHLRRGGRAEAFGLEEDDFIDQSMAMGSFVADAGGGGPVVRLGGARGFAFGGSSESHERTVMRGRNEIAEIAERLALALNRNFTRGRRVAQVAAACLYLACRQEKKPFLLIDFADLLQINVYVLGAVYLQLLLVLRLENHEPLQAPLDPSLFIHRFADRLNFGRKMHAVANTALRLVASMKRDWIQVAVVHVCEQTVRHRLHEFEGTEAGGLTPEEFEEKAKEWDELLFPPRPPTHPHACAMPFAVLNPPLSPPRPPPNSFQPEEFEEKAKEWDELLFSTQPPTPALVAPASSLAPAAAALATKGKQGKGKAGGAAGGGARGGAGLAADERRFGRGSQPACMGAGGEGAAQSRAEEAEKPPHCVQRVWAGGAGGGGWIWRRGGVGSWKGSYGCWPEGKGGGAGVAVAAGKGVVAAKAGGKGGKVGRDGVSKRERARQRIEKDLDAALHRAEIAPLVVHTLPDSLDLPNQIP